MNTGFLILGAGPVGAVVTAGTAVVVEDAVVLGAVVVVVRDDDVVEGGGSGTASVSRANSKSEKVTSPFVSRSTTNSMLAIPAKLSPADSTDASGTRT